MSDGYIVAWRGDDYFFLMGWDSDCEGAICYAGDGPVAVFPDKASARKAIAISTAFARLNAAQGKLSNTDFTDDRKHLRIVPLRGGNKRKDS